ncbi:MAG: HDOD domain-containing protein [Planctomycetota bacterium]
MVHPRYPRYSYREIALVADTFLRKYHAEGTVPVPLERIVDTVFGIDIVPLPDLERRFDTVAFTTGDLTAVYVDEEVYRGRSRRYLFTLAHEVGHLILHRDYYLDRGWQTVEEWKRVMQECPEGEYRLMEWQANTFARLATLSVADLADRLQVLEGEGKGSAWPEASFSLKDVVDLATLPMVASMALTVAEDPSSSAQDLQRVIEADPPLAAKVLRLANSSFFRRGEEVTDLQMAVVHLGFAAVRNLILGVSVVNSLDTFFAGARYDRQEFWLHCAAVGAAAKRIVEKRGGMHGPTAFVVGLLHDVGKLVMDRYLPEDFLEALKLAEEEGIPLAAAERQVLGVDHAAIGGELLELWGLPEQLTAPVRWHHIPSRCPQEYRPYAMVAQVADLVCAEHGIGRGGGMRTDEPEPASLAFVDVSEEDLSLIGEQLAREPLSPLIML